MNVFKADNAVWFDVDGTLIHHLQRTNGEVIDLDLGIKYDLTTLVEIKCPFSAEIKWYEINKCHVKLLKNCKAQNKKIIVWSAQGWQWCEAVVKALELERYVDLCIGKPHIIVDDKDMKDWPICNLFLRNGFGK